MCLSSGMIASLIPLCTFSGSGWTSFLNQAAVSTSNGKAFEALIGSFAPAWSAKIRTFS